VELGYRPHLAARSLRQTKSRHIGVAFAPVDAAEADLVEAIYPAAAEHGYQLVLSARTGTRSTQQAVDELLGYRCAAVIVIGSGLPAAELRELADRVTVPMVALGASQRSPAFDVVRSAGPPAIGIRGRALARRPRQHRPTARRLIPPGPGASIARHYSLLMDSSDPQPQARPTGPFRAQCAAKSPTHR